MGFSNLQDLELCCLNHIYDTCIEESFRFAITVGCLFEMTAVEGFRELWIVVIVSGAGVVVLGFDGFGEIDGFCFFAHGKSRCS